MVIANVIIANEIINKYEKQSNNNISRRNAILCLQQTKFTARTR